jgi:hypothetical protein
VGAREGVNEASETLDVSVDPKEGVSVNGDSLGTVSEGLSVGTAEGVSLAASGDALGSEVGWDGVRVGVKDGPEGKVVGRCVG